MTPKQRPLLRSLAGAAAYLLARRLEAALGVKWGARYRHPSAPPWLDGMNGPPEPDR